MIACSLNSKWEILEFAQEEISRNRRVHPPDARSPVRRSHGAVRCFRGHSPSLVIALPDAFFVHSSKDLYTIRWAKEAKEGRSPVLRLQLR
jgi:hypothetical protein